MWNFHFVSIVAVPVDESGSVSPPPRVIKILIWLALHLFWKRVKERLTLFLLFFKQLFAGRTVMKQCIYLWLCKINNCNMTMVKQ